MSSERSIKRKYGQEMTRKIVSRINSLIAAQSLGDFWPPYSGPERCHELKGALSGKFSFDLRHPYRLIVRPLEEISKEEFTIEKERWMKIEEVAIEDIVDTHD